MNNNDEKNRTSFIAQTAKDYAMDFETVQHFYDLYLTNGKNDAVGFYDELESSLQRRGFISC